VDRAVPIIMNSPLKDGPANSSPQQPETPLPFMVNDYGMAIPSIARAGACIIEGLNLVVVVSGPGFAGVENLPTTRDGGNGQLADLSPESPGGLADVQTRTSSDQHMLSSNSQRIADAQAGTGLKNLLFSNTPDTPRVPTDAQSGIGLNNLLFCGVTGARKKPPGWTLGTESKTDTEKANDETFGRGLSLGLPQSTSAEANGKDDMPRFPVSAESPFVAKQPVEEETIVSTPLEEGEFVPVDAPPMVSLQLYSESRRPFPTSNPLAFQSPVPARQEGERWLEPLAGVLLLSPAWLYFWAERSRVNEDPHRSDPV
jgi:hypothetical protein